MSHSFSTLARFAAAALLACCSWTALAAPPPMRLVMAASGFAEPTDIAFAPGDDTRLFVSQKRGQILVSQNGAAPTLFLDISNVVDFQSERGLLSFAFHPQYATNRAIYVYYNRADGAIVIARYLRNASNPNLADPGSAAVVLVIPHPNDPNYGGRVQFGTDGLLYIATGDGAIGPNNEADPFRSGQNNGVMLGKMLRIAVNGGTGYTIPAANPNAGMTCAAGRCPEILHYGLRNPWRFSFDRANGNLYIGDVGNNSWEEVDRAMPGQVNLNFGWGAFEGRSCFNDNYFSPSGGACAGMTNHAPPIFDYPHDGATGGFAVMGGYVYRGSAMPTLVGDYVYGDAITGRLWAARAGTGAQWEIDPIVINGNPIGFLNSFGQDNAGELYALDFSGGAVFRFVPEGVDPNADDDNDGVPNGVEPGEGLNPMVKDNDVFTRARLFAMQQYRDFLGREGDAGGIDFYTQNISNGSSTRVQVIENFLGSPEFQNGLPQCTRLYFSFFLRIPDYSGLMFQVGQYRAGVPLEMISQNFSNSPEFTNRYGSLTNSQYVDLVYQNVLGRAPDPEGRDFYLTRLNNGSMTRGQMMIGFSESPEFQQIIGDEVYVTAVYVGMLRRTPDQAGMDFYVNQIEGGAPRNSIITGFMNSPEYRNRFMP